MTISKSTGKKLSAREEWALQTGKPKEEYKSSSSKKSSKSSDSSGVNTKQLKALQSKYESVLKPTSEETATNTQLGNIITSKELGVAKAEAEPMAQSFVTGQSTALEKSAALKSLPLQTKLANLQSQRQAAADVLKAQLGFETSNVDRQTELAESQANREYQEKTFNEGVRQFNVSQTKSGSASSKSSNIQKQVYALIDKGKSWPDIVQEMGRAGVDIGIVDNILKQAYGYGTGEKTKKARIPSGKPISGWQYFTDGSRENLKTGEVQMWE
jgi:predicted fused transcriptional regulator/phosphomethylpyrimidine kinase